MITDLLLQISASKNLFAGKNLAAVVALIPLLPFFTFVVLGLFGRKYFKTSAGIMGTLSLLASTTLACLVAWQYFFIDGKLNGVYKKIVPFQINWLQFSPQVSIDMGALIDPVSVMMIVVVSFISLMVHIFSLGYMKGEERFATYYSFLSLFTFSMLGLVLASNLFEVYIFWELVGVSSFLLIGFYYTKPAAVAASKKAFLVTRLADLGFLIGILILSFYTGSLDINTIITKLTSTQSPQFISITSANFLGVSVLTWGLSLIFIGGAGKSALFPLHIWLPDAMEGPTPVSALIHAATMVVAGVYLVARLFPIFYTDETALGLVTWVGITSALLAAIIACTQIDIKRVLAYSTMSQIGYMMFALGISGYGGENGLGFMASLFHLFTHAFFKSLLFLCAGAIIHLVHSNSMHDMGGLRKRMPITHMAFLIGCLSIAGLPPFSGFFSKEDILLAAFRSNKIVYAIALLTAALTAFYMFRLYFSIFWKKELEPSSSLHADGTASMKLPMIILSICSLGAGFFPFASYITSDGRPLPASTNWVFSLMPVSLVIVAIFIAGRLYKKQNEWPQKISNALGGLYTTALKKFYIDEVYLFITQKIIFNLIGRPAAWFDKNIVDGFMNGMASVTASTSHFIKGIQSGRIQHYVLLFFGGIVGLAVLILYLWK